MQNKRKIENFDWEKGEEVTYVFCLLQMSSTVNIKD